MKRITLCADDFGMHPDVSDAIVRLAQHNRLSATSCLVTSPHWPQDCHKLRPLKKHMDTGLHLNFTEGAGLSKHYHGALPGLKRMLWQSHCHILSASQLEEEISAQLDCFCETFDASPDFIDGHQHVHHLPQVRDALLNVLTKKGLDNIWLRSTTPMLHTSSLLKSRIIEYSGARSFRKLFSRCGFTLNSGFAGVYSLSEKEPFAQLIAAWLKRLPDQGLIMCHPSQPSSFEIEHLPARIKEFEFLMSGQFSELLDKSSITLHRLSHHHA